MAPGRTALAGGLRRGAPQSRLSGTHGATPDIEPHAPKEPDMVTKLTPRERADAMIARFEAQLASPGAAEAHDARRRAFVERCEAKYGIPSSEIHQAIDDGRLIESKEVCDWIFAHEVLEGIV